MPLNMDEALSQNGFLDEHFDAPGSSLSTFNSKEPIKLGLVQNGQQLTKHAEMKLDDIKREINVEEGEATARASGSGDVEMDDVVNSTDNASPKPDAPEIATAPIPRGSVIGFGPTNSFGSIDLAKEVKSITDARKRIKLGDKAMVAGASAFVRQPSLPSVCCYTIFDGGEGTTATAISEDASYMAAGSSESVIRLWSLKGENLKTREYGYATKIAQGGGKSHACGMAASRGLNESALRPNRIHIHGGPGKACSEACWAFWAGLLGGFRSDRRIGGSPVAPALLLSGWHGSSMVYGHVQKSRGIQGPCGSGLGRRMGTLWRAVCHSQQGQDSKALDHRPSGSCQNVCGAFIRCRC